VKVIILDRDGVINEDSDEYIKSVDEWVPIPGSLEAIARLTAAGYRVLVATNQSGVARGMFSLHTLAGIHQKMQSAVEGHGGHIEKIFFCPHGPEDHCDCRKPLPGLFHQIAAYLNAPLRDIPAVGDSFRDLEAAQSGGAMPILVRSGKGERTIAKHGDELKIPVYANLKAYVDVLLAH